MRTVIALLALLFTGSAIAQQAQPVIPLVGTPPGAAVTTANPMPIVQGTVAVGSGSAGYPAGATPVANSATGTTGAVVATLPGAANVYTYLCNFQVSAAGTVTVSPITVAGTLGGSLVFQGITAGGAPFTPPAFTPCVRSSAVNTAITVTTTADASASAVDVQASGYQQ